MKRLYLIRHAKSSWKHPALADFDRPLNKRGKRDAPFMGKRLKKYASRPDLMVSSPAKRALKTAGIMAKELGFPVTKIVTDASIYAAGVSDLLDVIHNIDDAFHRVMMYGHNPGLTRLAEHLTHRRVENIPTCGIFCIDFDIDSWREVPEGGGRVVFFDYPKKYVQE